MKLVLCLAFVVIGCDGRPLPEGTDESQSQVNWDGGIPEREKRQKLPNDAVAAD